MPTDPQTTVRVRILVAVDHTGKWIATGISWWSDKETRENAFVDDLAAGERYSWVEADVPLPTEAGPAIDGVVHAD